MRRYLKKDEEILIIRNVLGNMASDAYRRSEMTVREIEDNEMLDDCNGTVGISVQLIAPGLREGSAVSWNKRDKMFVIKKESWEG